MSQVLLRGQHWLIASTAVLLVAGCSVPAPAVDPVGPAMGAPDCQAALADDPLIGNWLSVRSRKGVVGELRTLFTLQPDGTMAYTEQLKRSGQPSQGLSESGCWWREGERIVLQTHESNGSQVDLQDPIYTNRYEVRSNDGNILRVREDDGTVHTARRMPSGYRLPF